MPNLQHILDSQKQLEDSLGSRMADFEKLLRSPSVSETKPNLERLTKEFTEFKSFALGVLKLLRTQIQSLASQVDELDCYNRRNALLFSGIPESDIENCTTLVLNTIQSSMNMSNVRASSIYLCHRLGVRSDKRVRPILVRFSDINMRDAVWKEKKKLKSSSTVVCEFLTKPRHELFMTARRHFGVTSCWSSNGAIYIKLPDNNRKRISSALELNELTANFPSVISNVVNDPLPSVSSVAATARPKASPKQARPIASATMTEPPQTRRTTAAIKSMPSK